MAAGVSCATQQITSCYFEKTFTVLSVILLTQLMASKQPIIYRDTVQYTRKTNIVFNR